jgi:hypothetical protein
MVPEWAPGLGVHAAFSWKALRVSAGVSAWLPVRETLEGSGQPGAAEQGAEFQLSSAFAELCYRLRTRVVVPAVCSGAELSLLRGQGFGAGVDAQTDAAMFVALLAGGRVFWNYSSTLSLMIGADALVPLGQRQFVFAGSEPAVVHAPVAGARLAFGAEWTL